VIFAILAIHVLPKSELIKGATDQEIGMQRYQTKMFALAAGLATGMAAIAGIVQWQSQRSPLDS
jgi:hypothetical protein